MTLKQAIKVSEVINKLDGIFRVGASRREQTAVLLSDKETLVISSKGSFLLVTYDDYELIETELNTIQEWDPKLVRILNEKGWIPIVCDSRKP